MEPPTKLTTEQFVKRYGLPLFFAFDFNLDQTARALSLAAVESGKLNCDSQYAKDNFLGCKTNGIFAIMYSDAEQQKTYWAKPINGGYKWKQYYEDEPFIGGIGGPHPTQWRKYKNYYLAARDFRQLMETTYRNAWNSGDLAAWANALEGVYCVECPGYAAGLLANYKDMKAAMVKELSSFLILLVVGLVGLFYLRRQVQKAIWFAALYGLGIYLYRRFFPTIKQAITS